MLDPARAPASTVAQVARLLRPEFLIEMTASNHVFVVVSGFGKRIIPRRSPCRFDLAQSGSVQLMVAENPPIIIRSDQPAAAVTDADITAGPDWSAWWLETSRYRIPFPERWTAHVSGDVEPSAFDLVGEQESMIFVQTPRRVPPVERMVAPGQRLMDRGFLGSGEYITVRYAHQGSDLLQRHVVRPLASGSVVMTLQCRSDLFPSLEPTQRFLVDNLLPGDFQGPGVSPADR